MKKYNLLLLIILLYSCKESSNKSDIYNKAIADGYKGPVKSVSKTVYYDIIEDFGEWRQVNDSYAMKFLVDYDINGRITRSELIRISTYDRTDTTKSLYLAEYIETDSGIVRIDYPDVPTHRTITTYKKTNDTTWRQYTYNNKGQTTTISQLTLNANGMIHIGETKWIDHTKGETETTQGGWSKFMRYYDEKDHLRKEIYESKQPSEYHDTDMYETVQTDGHGNKLKELKYFEGKPSIINIYEYTYYE